MAGSPVVATQLTDRAVRTKALWVHSLDVIKEPGQTGMGTPIETVEVIEEGPGGVSSMTFTIDDPGIAVVITDGDPVVFWDLTNDVPIFSGWVQSWSYVPSFGEQGRLIKIVAIGPEALLDWAVVPSLTLAAGLSVQAAIQAAVAAAIGVGPLRAFANSGSLGGSQALPIGKLDVIVPTLGIAVTLTAVTLREAIRQIIAADTSGAGLLVPGYATVDMYYGLRVFPARVFGSTPGDWTDLTITDTPAGAIVAEGLSHETNAAEIVRGVYVTGGNAAGTGFVGDGTGKLGPIGQISDATVLTAAALSEVALAYLGDFSAGQRGQFDMQDHSAVVTIHAGAAVSITDVRASVGVTQYTIMSIRKTFNAVRQNWTIAYGGLPPSAMKAVRRLTRTTLS